MRQKYHADIWQDGDLWIIKLSGASGIKMLVAQAATPEDAHSILHELITFVRDPCLNHKCKEPRTSGCCPDDFLIAAKKIATPASDISLNNISARHLFGRLDASERFCAVKLARQLPFAALAIGDRHVDKYPGGGPHSAKDLLVVQDLLELAPSVVASFLDATKTTAKDFFAIPAKDFVLPLFFTRFSDGPTRSSIAMQVFEVIVRKEMKSEEWRESQALQMQSNRITEQEVVAEAERRRELLKPPNPFKP